MRVLVGAIGHESNTFTPFLTTRDDFHILYGQEVLSARTRRNSLAGIIDTLAAHGAEIVPTVAAGAMPGGVVARPVYEEFKAAVLDAAHDVDGVCLFLHGAMRADGVDYCEDDLLRDLRARLGPSIPVSVALDMHANIMPDMASNANALVAYHTAPHDDEYETGVATALILLAMLERGVRTAVGFAKIPFLLPGEMAQTSLEPMAAMMRLVAEIEARPGVLSASLANGHCWADVPDVGVAAVVVTDGDAKRAQDFANELASTFWARRAEFGVSAEAYPVDEAVAAAMAAQPASVAQPESTVFLSDSGDNPGAGGTTDVPLLLGKLIEAGASNVLIAGIWDAVAVAECAASGVGERLTLSVGGKLDTRHGTPLEISGTVRLLSDGMTYRGALLQEPGRARLGPVAVVNVAGIDVILSSTRLSFEDPVQLHRLGLEALDYRIVVLKRGYLTTPFQAIAPRSILAFTPGATNCDVTQMEFRRLRRPAYPLDPDMKWNE